MSNDDNNGIVLNKKPDDTLEWHLRGQYSKKLNAALKAGLHPTSYHYGKDTDGLYYRLCDVNARNKFVLDVRLRGINRFKPWQSPLRVNESNFISHLWTHQKKMYSHMELRKQCMVAGEPRTGKTLPTQQLICDNAEYFDRARSQPFNLGDVLWIAPKSALRGLQNEKKKWGFYDTFQRFMVEMTYQKFVIEMKKFLNDDPASLITKVPRMVIFDESHKLKTEDGQSYKLAIKLVTKMEIEYKQNEYYVLLLTGTPAPRDPSDWFCQIEVIRQGWYAEGTKTRFLARLANFKQPLPGEEAKPYREVESFKVEEIEFLKERNKGIVEFFAKADCLDLPDVLMDTIEIDPHKEQLQALSYFRKLDFRGAQLQLLLRQVADGFKYGAKYDRETDKETRTINYFKTAKDQLFLERLEEVEDIGRHVVYCAFTATIDKLVKLAVDKGWTVLKIDGRSWEVKSSQPDNLGDYQFALSEMDASTDTKTIKKLLTLCQSDAGSMGLEFSSAPSMDYYSNSCSGGSRMQNQERNLSGNSKLVTDKVSILDYICMPIDQLILDAHNNKKLMQELSLLGDRSKNKIQLTDEELIKCLMK